MIQDFTIFLWLLKLGVLVNLSFLANTFVPPESSVDPSLLVPAQILFAVSAFRCLFPNQYKGNVVFHDTPLSSIFLTRLLATFAEVAFIYQLSHVLRLLNVDRVGWVDAFSWLMVMLVVVSQVFVWSAILTGGSRSTSGRSSAGRSSPRRTPWRVPASTRQATREVTPPSSYP